jgi:gas vesicle protein
MAKDDGAGAGSILLAFLLGAVSGAAVALLYAPTTGRETREYLTEKAREGRVRAAEAAQKGRQAVEKGRQAVNEGREVLTNAIERGREAYQQARGDSNA